LKVATRNFGPKGIIITIADDGVGIPEENIPQIFESFFTTKKSGSGVGLGLSVVQGIIRDHHGTIEVDSAVGRGSNFTIHLPAAKPGEKHVAS
jgi:signal transduction histidine kinase